MDIRFAYLAQTILMGIGLGITISLQGVCGGSLWNGRWFCWVKRIGNSGRTEPARLRTGGSNGFGTTSCADNIFSFCTPRRAISISGFLPEVGSHATQIQQTEFDIGPAGFVNQCLW